MGDGLSDADGTMRHAAFAVTFLIVAAAEGFWPRRVAPDRFSRWPVNLALALINLGVVRLVIPMSLLAVAAAARNEGLGILNVAAVPTLPALILAVVALDVALYWQHRAFHAMPWLWRLHRVHHADVAFDVTTGLRFHPFEALVSFIFKAMVVLVIGAPPEAVFVFEVVLSTASLFNHGNLGLPVAADRLLRFIWVTPDMHRIHHSVRPEETDRNFGFSVSCWDRFFHTWQQHPTEGQIDMVVGAPGLRGPAKAGVVSLLAQPFRTLRAPGARDAIESGKTERDL